MLLSKDGYDRELEFPAVLSDEQWERIARRSGLPVGARLHIDDAIGLYRSLRNAPDSATGKLARDKLDSARETVSEALDALRKIEADDQVFSCLALGQEGRLSLSSDEQRSCRRALERFGAQLQGLAAWYEHAMDRVFSNKPGPRGSRQSLLALVQSLNFTLKTFTGNAISRSEIDVGPTRSNSFEFVWEVCHIADDTLGRAAVEAAVKEVVSLDRADEVTQPFEWDVPPLLAKE